MILKVANEMLRLKTNFANHTTSAQGWLKEIGDKLNMPAEMVEIFEDKLVELHLLAGRTYSDRSGIGSPDTCRLTSLALKFCDFISEYEDVTKI